MTELRRKKTASILWLLHLQLSLPIDEACYHIFHLFLLYIHPFPALSPFNPWHTHRVLDDFLSAKVASPYDMESTAMLFQEKILTDAPRIFC